MPIITSTGPTSWAPTRVARFRGASGFARRLDPGSRAQQAQGRRGGENVVVQLERRRREEADDNRDP